MNKNNQNFRLSSKSLEKLKGVHPDMIKVLTRAIELTSVDFGVTEGLRTRERQEELFKFGKSKTMNSRHLTGKAVDLVAYQGTSISWELSLYSKIADAIRQASSELGIPVIWGACWDKGLQQFSKSADEESKDYIKRRKELGKSAFIDAVHFELDAKVYP